METNSHVIGLNNWNVGIDLIKIDRFKSKPFDEYLNFYQKIFTTREIEYCLKYKHPASHFAGTFAAKEAVYKALNEFFPVKLNEIEIVRIDGKIPKIRMVSSHKSNNDNNGVEFNGILYTIRISISHSQTHAIAIAIVAQGEGIPIDPANISEMIEKYDF